MKKNRFLIFSLISIILFNIFFLILLLFYNEIIIIPSPFFKNVTREYWYWHTSQPYTKIQNNIISITFLFKLLLSLIFLGQFLYIILDKKYKNVVEKGYIIKVIVIGSIIYLGNFLFIKYIAEHYRLFMTLTPTVILSMMLLSMVLKVRKYLKQNNRANYL